MEFRRLGAEVSGISEFRMGVVGWEEFQRFGEGQMGISKAECGVVRNFYFRKSGVGLSGISIFESVAGGRWEFRRCCGVVGGGVKGYFSIQYRNRPQLGQRQIFLFLSLSVARAMGMTW